MFSSSVLQGELLSPCRCDGSVRCTHQPCLIRWISERGSWSCELCYFKYQVLAISTKNPLQVTARECAAPTHLGILHIAEKQHMNRSEILHNEYFYIWFFQRNLMLMSNILNAGLLI